jgi:2'-5' RNA ligase
VAFDLPVEIRQTLSDLIARLKSKYGSASAAHLDRADGVRWTRPEALHVTLKFIGHAIDRAETEKFASVRAALASVRSSGPAEMRFRGVGVFPDARRPRVLYCGVEASANLAPLAAAIERALEPMGIPPEGRAFVPHLTLARFNSKRLGAGSASGGVDELLHAAAEMASSDFGLVRETEFHLYESLLKPSGSEYKKIETYSFWKEAA